MQPQIHNISVYGKAYLLAKVYLGAYLFLTGQMIVFCFFLGCVGSGNNDDDFYQTNLHCKLMGNMITTHACMVWVN